MTLIGCYSVALACGLASMSSERLLASGGNLHEGPGTECLVAKDRLIRLHGRVTQIARRNLLFIPIILSEKMGCHVTQPKISNVQFSTILNLCAENQVPSATALTRPLML